MTKLFLKKCGLAMALTLVVATVFAATALAQSPKVSGNNAAFRGLANTDYPTGPTVSFVPTSSFFFDNGRGDLVLGNKNFYTEISGAGYGATDFIHAAPWNGGLGGP